MREANDGAAFVRLVRALGLDIEVVEGREEARLAAAMNDKVLGRPWELWKRRVEPGRK